MEKKYTRDQIKDAIWQELKESDYAGKNNDRAYEIIGIVMAGVDKIVVGDAQVGAGWDKASEFKHLPKVHYCGRSKHERGFLYVNIFWDTKGARFVNGTFEASMDFEILDESGTAAAGREEDAVTFAEWLRETYQPDEFSLWIDHAGNQYTTAKLYDIFKQQKEK